MRGRWFIGIFIIFNLFSGCISELAKTAVFLDDSPYKLPNMSINIDERSMLLALGVISRHKCEITVENNKRVKSNVISYYLSDTFDGYSTSKIENWLEQSKTAISEISSTDYGWREYKQYGQLGKYKTNSKISLSEIMSSKGIPEIDYSYAEISYIFSDSVWSGYAYADAEEFLDREIRTKLVSSQDSTEQLGSIKFYFPIRQSFKHNENYLYCSIATVFCINLFGFPEHSLTCQLPLEVTIYDKNNNEIRTYTTNGISTEYSALYWGYDSKILRRVSEINALKNGLNSIIRQINKDRNFLEEKLR